MSSPALGMSKEKMVFPVARALLHSFRLQHNLIIFEA